MSIFNPDLSLINFLFLLKVAIIAGLTFYILFSIVIIRQTLVLQGTLKTKVSPLLSIIAFLNFVAALGILLFTVAYL